MSLDMLFIYHSFIKELPDSYIQFVSDVQLFIIINQLILHEIFKIALLFI